MGGSAFEDLVPRRAAPRRGGAPTAVQNRRLEMGATGESIESANVNQAQGRTALAVDAAVVPDDIGKRRADSTKSQLDALEASVRSRIPGGLATQDERQTAYNYLRMQDALMGRDMAIARDKKAAEAPLIPELVKRLPLGELAANYMVKDERRQVDANNKALLDAALWLSTGAAYNARQEDNNYWSYFAQPGDDKKTMADKDRRLRALIQSARVRASMGLTTPGGKEALNELTSQAATALPVKERESGLPAGLTPAGARAQARAAIQAGKNRAMVLDRLKQMGVDTTGL